MKQPRHHELTLSRMAGGGQVIGTLADGRKAFVWGGLPGERVTIRETSRKAKYIEGVVFEIRKASPYRIQPHDPESYLSTSPWQIMDFEAEQSYKAELISDAFRLHGISLPGAVDLFTDGVTERYRNKVEFSWYSETKPNGEETLDLAFFRRGSKGKVIIHDSLLLPKPMIMLAHRIRDDLDELGITARQLKSLMIRCDQKQRCVWQLYTKDKELTIDESIAKSWPSLGGEVIYSDPRSPASRITERLLSVGKPTLIDTILGKSFRYVAEGFFQVNVPVYEQALVDMKQWILPDMPVIDLYAGVGTIGLTIGGDNCTLIEVNQFAVEEMRQNIDRLDSPAKAVLAASEKALDYISKDSQVIVDPPRAGLHADLINRLLQVKPPRIIYLSCNPVTQARDIELLSSGYDISHHRGYNFFPRTPHIEHLVVLDAKS